MSDDDAKRALRREVSARIAQINQHARAFRAQRATDYALRSSALVHAKLVLSYRAMSDEINADALTMHLRARGVRIAFPCVDARQKLVLLEVVGSDPFAAAAWTTDHFGIRVPRDDSSEVPALVRRVHARDLDALIVPLRAFDLRGARLGRGKGFYDGLINSLRPDARAATLGFAFETQLVSEVPEAAHDARVAFLATERRLIHTKRSRQHA